MRLPRINRRFFASFIPHSLPTFDQFQNIGLFLKTWEKRVIAIASAIALFTIFGLFLQIRSLNTVPTPANGGIIRETLVGQPRFLNPLFAASDVDRDIARVLFLPLCDFSENHASTVAETCKISDDGISADITLNASRAWHDGKQIAVDDILFTFDSLKNNDVQSPWQSLAKRFSATKLSNTAVRIAALQPTSELKTILSLAIAPAHILKTVEPRLLRFAQFNEIPIGSGPMRFASATKDVDGAFQSITLAAYENFNPTRPHIENITFRFADTYDDAKEMFRTRQIDALFWYDPTDTAEFIKRDVRRFEISPPVIVSLFFNPYHAQALKKLEARQAISMAIDRARLIKNALSGQGTPTRVAFPSGTLDETGGLEPEFDESGAKILLKRIGWSASTTLTLAAPAAPAYQAAAAEIASQLGAAGVAVSVAPVSFDDPNINLSLYDMILLGQNYGEYTNAFPFWHSSQSVTDGANYARYQDKEADRVLEDLRTEINDTRRKKLLKKINARLVTDLPAVFLFQPTYQYYLSTKIQGIKMSDRGLPETRFNTLSDWYMETKKERK